jgi:hypothetical protein
MCQDYPTERVELLLWRRLDGPHPSHRPGMRASPPARQASILRVDGHPVLSPDHLSQCVLTLGKTGC